MNLLFSNSIVLSWRKGRDSNPRYVLPHAGFQDRYLQPLGHPSVLSLNFGGGGGFEPRYRSLHTNDLGKPSPSATWVLLQIHYLVYHRSAIINSFIVNRV